MSFPWWLFLSISGLLAFNGLAHVQSWGGLFALFVAGAMFTEGLVAMRKGPEAELLAEAVALLREHQWADRDNTRCPECGGHQSAGDGVYEGEVGHYADCAIAYMLERADDLGADLGGSDVG